MANARRLKSALQLTPYFHCTSRCVRGAYLCGVNHETGQNLTHRRRWLRSRLLKLSTIFSIKIAAFAIMENHFHVVLKVERELADSWSDQEVMERWHQLFKGTDLSRRRVNGECLTTQEGEALALTVKRWRMQLADISWFMRCTKEPLARMANREDGCKGRFWEGRFHSQILLDAQALLACMTYVDLNPMRARICTVPEDCRYCSLYLRAKAARTANEQTLPASVLSMAAIIHGGNESDSLISTHDYLNMVDLVARQSRSGKNGKLDAATPTVLDRIGIRRSSWPTVQSSFRQDFHVLVGSRESIANACSTLGQRRAWGQKKCDSFFYDPTRQRPTDTKPACLNETGAAYQTDSTARKDLAITMSQSSTQADPTPSTATQWAQSKAIHSHSPIPRPWNRKPYKQPGTLCAVYEGCH